MNNIINAIEYAIETEREITIKFSTEDENFIFQAFIPEHYESDGNRMFIYSDVNVYSIDISDVEELEGKYYCNGGCSLVVLDV